ILNNSANGHNVYMYVTTSGIDPLLYTIENGTTDGHYILRIPANQWGDIVGWKSVDIFVNWTGSVAKYENHTITVNFRLTSSPTELFLSDFPLSTPYGDNVTFSVTYWDIAGGIGIVNSTGPYSGNVTLYVEVLTAGETLTQADMVITEIGLGEYQIEFNTSLLSGLVSIDLRIYANWTSGVLPLYSNSTLVTTINAIYRQTQVQWTPLPVTPYDGSAELQVSFIDVGTSTAIANDTRLSISVVESGVLLSISYNPSTHVFSLEINTTYWSGVGSFSFHLSITWDGAPYYQNRTSTEIPISIRYRNTDLSHLTIQKVSYLDNVTIVFTFTDLDDLSTATMTDADLTLDAALTGFYTVYDEGNGNYTLILNSTAFGELGVFLINASIQYNGNRYCLDATDFFYLTINERNAILTGDQIDAVPFLSLANLTLLYSDDLSLSGIDGAVLLITAPALTLNIDYFVYPLGSGEYEIRIDTTSLGSFAEFDITITATWYGAPYYSNETITIPVEVTRRDSSVRVSVSPLSTPYLELFDFEIIVEDLINGMGISITKSELTLTYGSSIEILGSEYTLVGSNGVYLITLNSTIVTNIPVTNYPIYIEFHWGDTTPFYSNSSTSTRVTVTARNTQSTVLSTPPAYYNYNTSVIVAYADYLSGDYIPGALVTYICTNDTSVSGIAYDNGDGTYTINTNTSQLATLGRYRFRVNFTWAFLEPYYANITNTAFLVTVNPVSTLLLFTFSEGVSYYPGDLVTGNISFTTLETGFGIDGTINSNWNDTYSTDAYIEWISTGLWSLTINTTGLNAQPYSFEINATKFYHINQTITVDILLSALPLEVELETIPTSPTWGDTVQVDANVTDARTGDPILGASVNLTVFGQTYEMAEIGGGIYRYSLLTSDYDAGEIILTIDVKLINHESRERDFQIRISKVDASLSATLNPLITINGETATIRANYSLLSDGTEISSGNLSYSWVGGSGFLVWSPGEQLYVGVLSIDNVPVGSNQILLVASSKNYKSVSLPLNIDIREINTAIIAEGDETVLHAYWGDFLNVTVFLNNTDTADSVNEAALSYGIGASVGSLLELGSGYYYVLINTTGLDIRSYLMTVSSVKNGYTSSSLQFTIEIENIPTSVEATTGVIQTVYYGSNATFNLYFEDIHNNLGIQNATGAYNVEQLNGTLLELGNGTYELTIDSSSLLAASVPYDISISFLKDKYEYIFTTVQILVLPIPTEIVGNTAVSIPVGDDFRQLFTFNDTLNNLVLINATTATVVWEFGTAELTSLENGSYTFGFSEAQISRLELGTYPIRVIMSLTNYETSEFRLDLTIREINTSVTWRLDPPEVYAGTVFFVDVTYFDEDHQVPILSAGNSSIETGGLTRIPEQEFDFGNGTYRFAFIAPNTGVFDVDIILSRVDYSEAIASVTIYPGLSETQLALLTAFQYGTIFFLAATILGALYFRVLAVPKLLRILRRMVSKLSKGGIPTPAAVRLRRQMILDAMNEDLASVNIIKHQEDVAVSTIQVEALNVEALLEELAQVVGLTETDIDVLRVDLDRMRPSERPGFISEVIRQERLRRAQDLAEAAAGMTDEPAVVDKISDEDLEDFKQKLIKMGIDDSEVEIMMEQAKSLTKAELDALLDQLGGSLE
ncbi:MAG: hypothetical protein ACFFF4_16375, partial [Candidatus Thorarchaeota archaeon]